MPLITYSSVTYICSEQFMEHPNTTSSGVSIHILLGLPPTQSSHHLSPVTQFKSVVQAVLKASGLVEEKLRIKTRNSELIRLSKCIVVMNLVLSWDCLFLEITYVSLPAVVIEWILMYYDGYVIQVSIRLLATHT